MSERKKQQTDFHSHREENRNMCPVTVRFPYTVWEAIRSLSAERDCSMAHLVRQIVEYGVSDIDQHFLREDQLSELRTAVIQLMDVISQIQRELHRIGVNYNQQIKLRNIEQKYKNLTDIDSRMAQIREAEAVRKDSNHLSKEELENIISRYEEATRKAGEVLCRILG